MKIKAFDTENILYKLLKTDILYIQFTDNKKSLNSDEVSTSQISICLNYDNTDVYGAFKTYQDTGDNKYLQDNILPNISEYNTILNIIDNNLIQLDFTAKLTNNFVIVQIKDTCINPTTNNYIYNNINSVKQDVMTSSFEYFNNMINITSSVIYILNDVDDKIYYNYINTDNSILNISTIQPYFKYTDDKYSTENIIINDYTLAVYDKIFEIDSIDYTESHFIFRFYIYLDNMDFLLNTNNVYCNQYSINVNSSDNIIKNSSTYTLSLYEKINNEMFKINDIIYIHNTDNDIIYIAKINNIDLTNNNITLTNLWNRINIDTTVSTIDMIKITKILNLKNYYDTYKESYIFELLNNVLPINNYIIEPKDYYELMF